MSIAAPQESLKLTAPGVGEEYVSAEFAQTVRRQIQVAQDYLAGNSDETPAGFVQARGEAYLPHLENARDFFVEQFSKAFGQGTYGLDDALSDYEQRSAEHSASSDQEQPTGSHPNAITLRAEPWMKKLLGLPNPDVEEPIPGCIVRGVDLPGSTAERGLKLFEFEVPRQAAGETEMSRLLIFIKK
jgi:hypothetical protein